MDFKVQELSRQISSRLRSLEVVNAASLRSVCGEFSARIADMLPARVFELALDILDGHLPGRYVIAFELILRHPLALSAVRARHLDKLGATMNGWGEVDMFCAVSGRAWRQHQVTDQSIHRWAKSDNRWWRRAALVSTVPLNVRAQGCLGDTKRTLSVCRLLVDDRDDMVVKAMSWALRALAVRDPSAVRAFLAEYEPELAPRALREVRNKLTTGVKNPRTRTSGDS